MNLEQAGKNLNRLQSCIKRKNSLEHELEGLLESGEITKQVQYNFTTNFGAVKLLVTTEALVAAVTRDLSIVRAEIANLLAETGEILGI